MIHNIFQSVQLLQFYLCGIFAWEASCPNQYPSSCKTMEIDGVQTVCNCDDYKYSLATGQLLSNSENDSYPMKLYFSEKNGNSVRISN